MPERKQIMKNALVFALTATIASFAQADEVQVAVAANFTAPMQQIAAQFENIIAVK